MEQGQFVAIRMIVVNPDKDKEEFKKWMAEETSPGEPSFLDEMWNLFHVRDKENDYILERITFLQGNKDGRQSHEGSGTRADSTAAGANADFAWITCWKSKDANQTAWSDPDRPVWDTWKEFLAWCHPRTLNWEGDGTSPARRPLHGPPYDYRGAPPAYYGKGAGCLVEGFEVVKEWS